MNVLIACEYSGIVRDAFIAKGHNAISCDLLDTETPGPHYKGNVMDIINQDWDMMIAHPPCTYLTISANKWYKDQPPRKSGKLVGNARREARKEAKAFFISLFESKIPLIAVENPIGIMSTEYKSAAQVIQPWMFGHPETKATCLWLKGLPPLRPTNVVPLPSDKRKRERLHHLTPSKDRWKIRSKTFEGIALAMADQWGTLGRFLIQQKLF